MIRYVRTSRPIRTFIPEGPTCSRFEVDAAGVVRAWSEEWGYYTSLHDLSPHQMGAIRCLAKKAAPVGDD